MTADQIDNLSCRAVLRNLRGYIDLADTSPEAKTAAHFDLDFLLAELARTYKVLRRIADDAASYGPSSRYECSILLAALDRIADDAESALGEQP